MIGIIAAVFTTLSFIPQALQVIRTKNTADISLVMYLMFVLGVILWTVYGFIILDLSIILANSITCVLASVILMYKIKYS